MLFISNTLMAHLIMSMHGVLKDQPQYKELLNEGFSKRYNPDTPTSFEHDSTTPLVHSIGKRQQKEEQTKIYEKFF